MLFLLILIYQAYSFCVSPYIIHDKFSQNCDSIACVNENTEFPCANLTKIKHAMTGGDTFEGSGVIYDRCDRNVSMIELEFANDVFDFTYKNYHFLKKSNNLQTVIEVEGQIYGYTQGQYFVLVFREDIDLYVDGVKKCSIDGSQLSSGDIEFGTGTNLNFITVWDYEFGDVMILDIMQIRQHESERNFEYCFETFPKCYDIGALEPETCSTHGKCSSLNNCTCCPGYFGSECESFDEWLICTPCSICEVCPTCEICEECPEPEECPTCNKTDCPTCNKTGCPTCNKTGCPTCNKTDCPELEECPTCNKTDCPKPEDCPTCNVTDIFDITKFDLNGNLVGTLSFIIVGYLIVTSGLGILITWIVIGYRKSKQ